MNSRNTMNAMLAAAPLVIAACSSNSYDPPVLPPAMANEAPVISAIGDQTVDQDTVVSIEFGVTDSQTDAAQLALVVMPDGSGVFAADGATLGGAGIARTLTLMPLEARTGTAMISVMATDPQGLSTSRTFAVTVNARAASLRDVALASFAKSATDEVTAVNGLTFTQDADDPAAFEPLLGAQ
jgi:hypothetical protein